MKKLLMMLATVIIYATAIAQQPESAEQPLPEYAYCEIIASHLPAYTTQEVLFDFGQPTQAWAYNWLKDDQGAKLLFNSGIEALNYMVGRGWEFVQAFTSGEKNSSTHYLLRIASSQLTEEQKQQLLNQPDTKQERKSKERK